MCDEDDCNCDMTTFLTFCFCFKLCCDQNTQRGGMSTSNEENDDNKPLKGAGVQPSTPDMSRFKF